MIEDGEDSFGTWEGQSVLLKEVCEIRTKNGQTLQPRGGGP